MDGTARLAGILDAAIANRWCSAAALQVGDAGREVLTLARGLTRTLPAPGVPVDADAIFDLASVTKPIVTTALAMVLASRGALDLDAAAATLVPQVDPRVRVLHLLGHVSGLPPHVKFLQRLMVVYKVLLLIMTQLTTISTTLNLFLKTHNLRFYFVTLIKLGNVAQLKQ